MSSAPQFLLFAGSASQNLSEAIIDELNTMTLESPGAGAPFAPKLGQHDLIRFSDGEMMPEYGESIRGHDLFLVQSTHPPADNIMELLLMIDAAKRASANSITAVIPYFGYARQDRKAKSRVSIGAKLLADMLTAAGASRVVTMDLHAGQIQGFFDIPLDNLDASAVFIPYLRELDLDNLAIATPDMGGANRARMYARHLTADLVLVDKFRERPNAVASMQLIGNVEGKNVVIVDDIVDTAGTLTKAAKYIMDQGAQSVRAAITHPILSGPAYERVQGSVLAELLVTDTVPVGPKEGQAPPERIRVLSIASVLAKALRNIYNLESVSELFLK